MMARRGVLGLLGALGGGLALSGCNLLRGDPEVRYRVTVTVDTPQGERSGSSVWSWTLKQPTVALVSAYEGEFHGEAVAVDLPGGRTLFAILRGMDGDSGMAELMPERVFGDIGRTARGEPTRCSPDRIADLRDIAGRTGETAMLDCAKHLDWCPMLVTFADENDPASVALVDPANLTAQFGPGTALRGITVELTDDAVTRVIERRVRWLPNYFDKMLDGSSINNSTALANSLSQIDFINGTRP